MEKYRNFAIAGGIIAVLVLLFSVVSCQPRTPVAPADPVISRVAVGEPRQETETQQCFEEWEYKKAYRDEPVYTIKKVKKQEKVYKWDTVRTKSCTTNKGKRSCTTSSKQVKKFVGYKTKWVDEKVKTGTKKVEYKKKVADYGTQEVTTEIQDIKITYKSGRTEMTTERNEVETTECD